MGLLCRDYLALCGVIMLYNSCVILLVNINRIVKGGQNNAH
jgi:hypothetical protein